MSCRCECCNLSAQFTCGVDMQPMLGFCRKHFIQHLTEAHPQSSEAQSMLKRLRSRKPVCLGCGYPVPYKDSYCGECLCEEDGL